MEDLHMDLYMLFWLYRLLFTKDVVRCSQELALASTSRLAIARCVQVVLDVQSTCSPSIQGAGRWSSFSIQYVVCC